MANAVSNLLAVVEERACGGLVLKKLEMPVPETEDLKRWAGEARENGWVEELVSDRKGYGDDVPNPLDAIGVDDDDDSDDLPKDPHVVGSCTF